MITVKKEGDLIRVKDDALHHMKHTLSYDVADSFCRSMGSDIQVYTLVFKAFAMSTKSVNGAITINFTKQGKWITVDIYSSSVFADAIFDNRQKEKEEEKVAKHFLESGFVRQYDAPIITEDRARIFFTQLECSHENMEQYPTRHKEYLRMNISEDQEASWSKSYHSGKKIKALTGRITSQLGQIFKDEETPAPQSGSQTAPVEANPHQNRSISKPPHPAAWTSLLGKDPLTAPVTSLSQARKFYIALGGSYSRMREEYPERYEEYKRCGVTKAHEDKWRKRVT